GYRMDGTTPTPGPGAFGGIPYGSAGALNATGRLPPQSRLGSYQILRNVGQGGMAAVYKAIEVRSGKIVAIKEMSQVGLSPDELKEALDSFRFEAQALSKLSHRNLPKVYQYFSENTRHYLVMEFIEGKTLEQKLADARGAALPESDVLAWTRQICDVLSYLHRQRPPIIFRDLKPANIMVTAQGQVKLIDFGIARVFAPGRSRDTQVLGTPGFAPPEQYGKAQTDPRADIYALGCTLYQLLTAYDPATSPFKLPPMRAKNPAVSARTQHAIEKATQLDRDARYATVDDFARDLPPAGNSSAARGGWWSGQSQTAQSPRVTNQHPVTKPSAAAPKVAAKASPPTMAAVVVAVPHEVDFGTLNAGQRGEVAITISGQGGIPVKGEIKPLASWVRAEPGRFDGKSTVVRIIADTALTNQTGSIKSEIQLVCDGKQMYLPARVQIKGTAQGKATNAKPASAAKPSSAGPQRAPKTKPTSARPIPRKVRFVLGLAGGVGLAAGTLVLFQRLLETHTLRLPLTAPLALGALLLASILAGIGALLFSGSARAGRFGTSLFGALTGFIVILFGYGSGWFWHGLASAPFLLEQTTTIPLPVQIGVPLAAGLGGAIGADRRIGPWMQAVGEWFWRNVRPFLAAALIFGGGWLGFSITQGTGVFAVCLTPLAVIAGVGLGIWIALTFNL
ncbi:MAG TPA: serine/threonine-protein kinase, partial [Ktedonobacterales bacterium]|nr:serine/threonine-protein kinase [Ktedonobacterales bacterium]